MNRIINGDCLNVLKPFQCSISNLIVTSPPFANQRKRSYGGIDPNKYVDWFLERAEEFRRVLTPDGSMILNLAPHTEKGRVATYVNELVLALSETWYWKSTYWWRKTNAVPVTPSHRLKNAIEPCYHFALQNTPAFFPEQAKRPAKPASIERANRLIEADLERRQSTTASVSGISMGRTCRNYYERQVRLTGSGINFADKPESICDSDFMAYPDNVIECACERRNLQRLFGDPKYDNEPKASAPFPEALPAFFIKLMTRRGDSVLDPFAGSGTSIITAQRLCRNGLAIEKEEANIRLIINRLKNKRRKRAELLGHLE
jgi:site-specific DNA-methyltransferase (adenine-specific)